MKSPLKPRQPHYTRVFTAILSDPRIGDKESRIYLLIKSFEGRSNSAYPTVATLMKLSGNSKSTVLRSISKLQKIGLLRVTSTHMGNRRNRNLYLIDDIPYIARIPIEILRLRKSNFKASIGPLETPMMGVKLTPQVKPTVGSRNIHAFSSISFSGMNQQ